MADFDRQKQKNAKILSDIESLVAIMPGHVYWKGLDGIYLGANEAQINYMSEFWNKKLIGNKIEDIFPRAIADKINADDNYVMLSGEELKVEEITPENKVVLSIKKPIKNEDGEIIGMLGISIDITEQKKQEVKLQTAWQQTQIILDNIMTNLPAHLYWQDTQGVYLGCNNTLAYALGLSTREEYIGKTVYDFQPKHEAEIIDKINHEVMAKDKAISAVEKGWVNGREALFLSKKCPLKNSAGEVIGLLGISFDITIEKKAEKLREEKLVVETSLANAKLMAASIAHELRTPLATINSIAGNLEHYMVDVFKGYEIALAEDKIENNLNPDVLQYLKAAPKSLSKVTYAANTFIDMMLMKVNLENVKSKELCKLSMAAVVDESIKLYPLDDSEKTMLEVDLSKDFNFMGDSTLFSHLIFNLLKNALYYVKAARKGEILIWLELGSEANYLHFKDTGKGMTPEVLASLFGAFYSNTRHGTGVGLALCKLIMQEFGGEISCDSIEGQYTHFTMRFPK
ncbi:MAG: PAS domain-containing protein [Gammaproteobacteria bacterium]|nr:PAS domain-containing protein [Gammaproteobacteria bacterium]